MVGFVFLLSPFVSKSSSATPIGFSIFIVGFFTQIITTTIFPYRRNVSQGIQNVGSLFLPNLFAKALRILSDATSTPQDIGVSWSKRKECAADDDECLVTINDVYIWLVATFFLWVVLAIYFDNIIPNAAVVRKSIFYFLRPGYWTGKGGKEKEGGICSCLSSAPPVKHITPDDEDVLEKENLVKTQTAQGAVDPNVAVQIRGLAKTHAGSGRSEAAVNERRLHRTMLLRACG